MVRLQDRHKDGCASWNTISPDGVCHCLMRNPLLYSDNVRQSAVQTFSSLLPNDWRDKIPVKQNIDSMERGRRISFAIQGG